VIGVPVQTKALKGLDSLLSIVQMPKGVPVACMAIEGAFNAGLFATKILGVSDEKLGTKLLRYKERLRSKVKRMRLR
jgi:5-(carboxyamino)imidazole ribonucleotide mutase